MKNGFFVVFEGLDGSGSSTQAQMLQRSLQSRGHTAYLTSEPTNGPVGAIIRLAMSHRLSLANSDSHDDETLAYLFAADRHDHLHNSANGILKQLSTGATVISTRYFLSSYAYHCSVEDDFKRVERLNREFRDPDLTVYLDCPIEVCLRRLSDRQMANEKYEHELKLRVVQQNYERVLQSYSAPTLRLDATLPPQEIHTLIMEKIGR